jgi:hypothetical protein
MGSAKDSAAFLSAPSEVAVHGVRRALSCKLDLVREHPGATRRETFRLRVFRPPDLFLRRSHFAARQPATARNFALTECWKLPRPSLSINDALGLLIASRTRKCLPFVLESMIRGGRASGKKHRFAAVPTERLVVHAKASWLPELVPHKPCPPARFEERRIKRWKCVDRRTGQRRREPRQSSARRANSKMPKERQIKHCEGAQSAEKAWERLSRYCPLRGTLLRNIARCTERWRRSSVGLSGLDANPSIASEYCVGGRITSVCGEVAGRCPHTLTIATHCDPISRR